MARSWLGARSARDEICNGLELHRSTHYNQLDEGTLIAAGQALYRCSRREREDHEAKNDDLGEEDVRFLTGKYPR